MQGMRGMLIQVFALLDNYEHLEDTKDRGMLGPWIKISIPGHVGYVVLYFTAARAHGTVLTVGLQDAPRVLPLAENVNGRGTSERLGASILVGRCRSVVGPKTVRQKTASLSGHIPSGAV